MRRVDFIAIDEWFDAIAARHWPLLRRLGYALALVLLFAGVAAHAYKSSLAQRLAARCGCAPLSAPVITALSGVAAVLFVFLYTRLVAAAHRILINSWKHVRPGPPPSRAPRWTVVLHVLIGLVVFFWMATVRTPDGVYHANIDFYGGLGLIFGWWISGRALLDLFWPRPSNKS